MILHTGGATGSDNAFATIALNKGMDVIIHSFENHNPTKPTSNNSPKIIIHSEDELKWAYKSWVKQAASILGRRLSSKKYVNNLLARDYFQINDVDAIFAIGYLEDNDKILVKGGTGYAVTMGTIRNVKSINIFDLYTNKWYHYTYLNGEYYNTNYIALNIRDIKSIAGIGTRNINHYGINAIKEVVDIMLSCNNS